MSYTSTNTLRKTADPRRVLEVIKLLGYIPNKDGLRIPSRIGSFMWYERSDYKSWVGVELDVYKTKTSLKVSTRTRVGRSYWDLAHQNRTITLLRQLFGGSFITDAGSNRCWRPSGNPPVPISSGCFLSRWHFHNALMKARLYLSSRELKGNTAKSKPTGLVFMDEMNPRLLSNNFIIPYIIGTWEEYFRATFSTILAYAEKRDAVLKKARLSPTQLEAIASAKLPVEITISECFSFQRPSIIGDNFKLFDNKLDLASAFRKPYRNRTTTLFDSIEELIETRNALVHNGQIDLSLYDKKLQRILSDIVVAVDRAYETIGSHFGFIPVYNY